ncbi:MAG TPA: 30S ribosomal protein S20 [Fimbriimonadales bacterium]|nr:30S ribosomal protein S20 [Fimbriimonadales bacterium]
MPNIKSMVKDLKRNAKRRLRNQSTKSALKTYVKKAREAIGSPEGEALLREACRMLDKAAERGIIHKNQAARRKSRLMQAFNRSQSNA